VKKKNLWIISVLKPEEKRPIRRIGLGTGVGRRVWSQTVGTLKATLLTITIHTYYTVQNQYGYLNVWPDKALLTQ
jgi:hypothetical protein